MPDCFSGHLRLVRLRRRGKYFQGNSGYNKPSGFVSYCRHRAQCESSPTTNAGDQRLPSLATKIRESKANVAFRGRAQGIIMCESTLLRYFQPIHSVFYKQAVTGDSKRALSWISERQWADYC